MAWLFKRDNQSEATDDEQQDEQEGIEEEGQQQDDTEADELADLDDETRGLVVKAAERALGKQQAQVLASLQAQGLDLAADGTVVIRDARKAAEFTGASSRSAAAEPAAAAPAVAAKQEPADDEQPPDPNYDPVAFAKWTQKQIQRGVDAALGQVAQRQQDVEQWRFHREAEYAVERAKQLLPEYGLGAIVEHPDFEEKYREALSKVEPNHWLVPENLVRIGSTLIVDLKPATTATRGADGRFVTPSTSAVKQSIHRGALAQTGPAGDAVRSARVTPEMEAERVWAQRLNCTVDELRSLADETPASYRQARAKASKAGRR